MSSERNKLAAVFVACVLLLSRSGLSQQKPPLLQGSVIEAGSEFPIEKATVELRTAAGNNTPALASSLTDSSGRFYLPILNPGSYRIVALHSGHVTASMPFNSSSPPAAIRIPMTAAGVISGRVLDKGQPIGLADALVLKAIYTEGQLSFTPVLSIRADDQGEYHLFWVPPGRYYLVGVVWDTASSVPRYINPTGNDDIAFYSQRYVGRAVFLRATAGGILENEAHIPIFYPGTPDPRMAIPIDVAPGAQLRGMDIDASAVPTRRVLGKVDGLPAPTPGQTNPVRASISMRPLMTSLNTSAVQSPGGSSDVSGNFEIGAAAPGRYLLTATAGNLTGRALVEVRDRDVTNVVVALSPGANITGRITVEGNTGAAASSLLSSARIVLRSDPLIPGTNVAGVSPQPDGSFTITGVPASGDYRVLVAPLLASATPPDGTPTPVPPALQKLYVKSIRMGDVDVLNDRLHLENLSRDPMMIVIGSNPGSLEGHTAVGGMTVVLVHDDGLRFRVNEKSAVSDASGKFEIQNIPPGNYKLFAWESVEPGAWQDPDFMRPFESRGVPVQIKEGTSTTQNISIP
jgi:hypothetical protein